MIENFFTEERRIQRLIDDAVREERQRSKRELEKKQAEIDQIKAKSDELIARTQTNEISHMSKLGVSPEKIVEVTGFTPEFVNEVLNKNS